MPDHININQPGYGRFWQDRLHVLRLEAEIKNLQAERDKYHGDLEAIFTRIERGDEVHLYPENGESMTIIRKPETDAATPDAAQVVTQPEGRSAQ